MKQTQFIMGMPVTIEILDQHGHPVTEEDLLDIFSYFTYIDKTFSTYKEESEISQINKGILPNDAYSTDMKTILQLSEETRQQTNGYFNITKKDGTREPAGLVKGWAIYEASKLIHNKGYRNYYIDAGGDVQTSGYNKENIPWRIGIRNPFNRDEIIKVLSIQDRGVATSGTYIRGEHIYNPKNDYELINEIVSFSVIGPNIYEADRFATAAFAMNKNGIQFIESLDGFEGYMIDREKKATYTTGFHMYIVSQDTI